MSYEYYVIIIYTCLYFNLVYTQCLSECIRNIYIKHLIFISIIEI